MWLSDFNINQVPENQRNLGEGELLWAIKDHLPVQPKGVMTQLLNSKKDSGGNYHAGLVVALCIV